MVQSKHQRRFLLYENIIRTTLRHVHNAGRLPPAESNCKGNRHPPIGVCGKRRLHYLKHHRKVLYYNLLTSGKLRSHFADIEAQAQDLFFRLVKEYAEKEGVTEQLKATDQMKWVQRMNSIRECVMEAVCKDVVYV